MMMMVNNKKRCIVFTVLLFTTTAILLLSPFEVKTAEATKEEEEVKNPNKKRPVVSMAEDAGPSDPIDGGDDNAVPVVGVNSDRKKEYNTVEEANAPSATTAASATVSSIPPMCMREDYFDIRTSIFEHPDGQQLSAECLLLPAMEVVHVAIQGPEEESPFRGSLRGSVFRVLGDLRNMFLPPIGKDRPTLEDFGTHVVNAMKSVNLWKFVAALHYKNIQLSFYKQVVDVTVEYPEPSITKALSARHMLFIYREPQPGSSEEDHDTAVLVEDPSAAVVCGEARYLIPTQWSQWLKGEAQGRFLTTQGKVRETCQFQISSFVGGNIAVALYRDNHHQLTNGHAGFSKVPDVWRKTNTKIPKVPITAEKADLLPKLRVSVRHEIDAHTLRLIITMILIILLHDILVNNKLIQAFVSLAFGVLICLSVLIYFTTKDISKTRTGKVGLLALIGVGGWAALIEGMGSAVIGFALMQLTDNMIVQAIFSICVLLMGYFTNHWFGAQLQYATDKFLITTRMVISAYLIYYHPEMTLGFFSCRIIMKIVFGFLGVAEHTVVGRAYGDAQDFHPNMAHGAGDFRRTVAQGVGGRNAAERMRAFKSQGQTNTANELDKLAEFCRENPSKWVSKMRNPNLMSDFISENAASHDDDDYEE